MFVGLAMFELELVGTIELVGMIGLVALELVEWFGLVGMFGLVEDVKLGVESIPVVQQLDCCMNMAN